MSSSLSQGSNVMEEQDLREIGISDPQHRRKLLQAARSLPKVTTQPGPRPCQSVFSASVPLFLLPRAQEVTAS